MTASESSKKSSSPRKSAATSVRGIPGFVDFCEMDSIAGWAQIPFLPLLPAVVDLSINGSQVASVRANVFRQDLREQGIRDGFAGFSFKIPTTFQDGKTHQFVVTERISKKQLGGISQFQVPVDVERVARSELFLNSVSLASNANNNAFLDALKSKKKLAIICAFTPDNDLYAYHHRLIDTLKSSGFAVMLGQSYSDSGNASGAAVSPPISSADAFLVKDNLGYDFGTWLSCVVAVREHLGRLDELLLVNDSVFGPLSDFKKFSSKLDGCTADVLGVCDSYEHNYHLQSFFLLFRKSVLQSGFFESFVDDYSYSNEKDKVIRDGELALTPQLQQKGFQCDALYRYEDLAKSWLDRLPAYIAAVTQLPENAEGVAKGASSAEVEYLNNLGRHIRRGDPVNPTHYFWDILIELGCPFLKRELLFKNPINHPLLYRAPEIIRNSGYPIELVRNAAKRFGATKVYF
jgi:hypothetical protein